MVGLNLMSFMSEYVLSIKKIQTNKLCEFLSSGMVAEAIQIDELGVS